MAISWKSASAAGTLLIAAEKFFFGRRIDNRGRTKKEEKAVGEDAIDDIRLICPMILAEHFAEKAKTAAESAKKLLYKNSTYVATKSHLELIAFVQLIQALTSHEGV